MRTWKSLLATSLALGAGAAACGDDGGGTDIDARPTVDGTDIDAMPDAATAATRSGTIAVSDVRLTSAQAAGAGLRGGVISIEFADVTQVGGEVLFGTSPIGGCVVTRYDADGTPNAPNPTVDVGAIDLSGTGLLKTVGTCAFNGGTYTCVSDAGTGQVTGSSSNLSPFRTYVWTGTPFMDKDLVGSYLLVNGFADGELNTGGTPRPIVQQTASQITVLASGTDETPVTGEVAANAQFTVLNGVGPVPTNGLGFAVDADFLGDETTSVTVTKGADDDFGAIDFTTYVRGEGLKLADASAQPHEFPTDEANPVAVTFSCASADNGDCGVDADGDLEALIISGKTTDTPINGLPDYIMPPPTTQYATFQCGFFVPNDTGTLPMEAVAAILSTSPTRIETRVLSVAGTLLDDTANPLNQTRVLVGHGLIGHTTVQ